MQSHMVERPVTKMDVSNVETAMWMQSMVAVLHSGAEQKICKLFQESHINVLVTMIWLLYFHKALVYSSGNAAKAKYHSVNQ